MAELKDMDDAPELDEAWFAEAKPMRDVLPPAALKAFKMGRPKADQPKEQVTLRLDRDVIAKFKAGGAGWQTRINAVLRETPMSRLERIAVVTSKAPKGPASRVGSKPTARKGPAHKARA